MGLVVFFFLHPNKLLSTSSASHAETSKSISLFFPERFSLMSESVELPESYVFVSSKDTVEVSYADVRRTVIIKLPLWESLLRGAFGLQFAQYKVESNDSSLANFEVQRENDRVLIFKNVPEELYHSFLAISRTERDEKQTFKRSALLEGVRPGITVEMIENFHNFPRPTDEWKRRDSFISLAMHLARPDMFPKIDDETTEHLESNVFNFRCVPDVRIDSHFGVWLLLTYERAEEATEHYDKFAAIIQVLPTVSYRWNEEKHGKYRFARKITKTFKAVDFCAFHIGDAMDILRDKRMKIFRLENEVVEQELGSLIRAFGKEHLKE
jgi:hypothetical protein